MPATRRLQVHTRPSTGVVAARTSQGRSCAAPSRHACRPRTAARSARPARPFPARRLPARLLPALGVLVALAVLVGCRSAGPEERALGADAPRELRAEARACDDGNALSCHNVAVAWMMGEGVPQADDARALAIFTAACDAGADASCRQAARLMSSGSQGDVAGAMELLQRQCDSGERSACLQHAQQRLATGDVEGGITSLEHQCVDGGPVPCMELGSALLRHRADAPEQLARAITLLGDSCVAGLSRACRLRADALVRQAGDGDLPAEVVPLYGRSCLDGDAMACLTLSGFYAVGRGVEEDPDYAAELMRRACGMGLEQACRGDR